MKQKIMEVLKPIYTAAKKRAPEILTGIGIGGMILTTVLAVKSTPKALDQMEEKKKELKKEKLTPAETVQSCWTCYIPSAVTGGLSMACLIGANSVHLKRNAALATAFTLSETTLRDYKKKVAEKIGPKKEQDIRDEIAKDKIVKDPVSTNEVFLTGKGNTLCYDEVSGRYFRSDRDKIDRALNELNRRMMSEMYISLNDYYSEIGLPRIGLGDILGWNIDKGFISPDFSYQGAEDGTPCLVISYLVEPQYNFFS